jgi:hypothetical protein
VNFIEIIEGLVNLGLTSNPVELQIQSSAGLPTAISVKRSNSELN